VNETAWAHTTSHQQRKRAVVCADINGAITWFEYPAYNIEYLSVIIPKKVCASAVGVREVYADVVLAWVTNRDFHYAAGKPSQYTRICQGVLTAACAIQFAEAAGNGGREWM
jgi:hypothetical protein